MKKVAVIHTTPVTIPTLKKLLTDNRRPDEEEIEVINFLDDSMLPEINRLGHPSEGVKYRLNTLFAVVSDNRSGRRSVRMLFHRRACGGRKQSCGNPRFQD